jgi:HSP20 family protein
LAFNNIDAEDWFRRFTLLPTRFGLFGREDPFAEIGKMFRGGFRDITEGVPKDLVRERESARGDKVTEVGPLIYGYTMTIGLGGKPRVQEFGNMKQPTVWRPYGTLVPQITPEIEPLAEVTELQNQVKITLELPGVDKNDIRINAYEDKVEVTAESRNNKKKYSKTLDLLIGTDINSAHSTFKNGILEITFDRRKDETYGKEIKIE